MFSRKRKDLFAALILMGCSSLVWSSDRIVGTGPGEYATIQAAINAARPGDHVRVKPTTAPGGWYKENLLISTNNIYLEPYTYPNSLFYLLPSSHGIQLINNASNVTIQGAYIYQATSYANGICVNGGSNNTTINNCQFEGSGSGLAYAGIQTYGTQNVITVNGCFAEYFKYGIITNDIGGTVNITYSTFNAFQTAVYLKIMSSHAGVTAAYSMSNNNFYGGSTSPVIYMYLSGFSGQQRNFVYWSQINGGNYSVQTYAGSTVTCVNDLTHNGFYNCGMRAWINSPHVTYLNNNNSFNSCPPGQ